MNNFYKNPRWQAAALIVVIIIIGWFVLKKPGQKAIAPTTNNNNQQTQNEEQAAIISPETKTWEGILKLSNNPQKGNLMLETKEQTIYIKTARDFSQLAGKEVTVSYEGTLESFVLGDIIAK